MTGRRWRVLALAAVGLGVLLVLPHMTTLFFSVQVLIRTFWLGTIAATLTFLVRYGGMISLAQTAIYGIAAYVVANLSVVRGVHPWTAVVVALLAATIAALAIGLLAARARGVYFLMITLTAGVFVYYFALQYRPFTFGFGGINGVPVPAVGSIPFNDPINFYYLALGVSLVACAGLYAYSRSPLGLAFQGDRDCPERMTALGLNTTAIRIAGFTAAGLVAGAGGVLSVWFNGQVSPGSLDVVRTIDILVIAVLGGVNRIEAAWVGAFLYSVLSVYASDLTDYYNTAIGLAFIAVVVFSPGGAFGIASSLGNRIRTTIRASSARRSITPATPVLKEN